MGTPSQQHDEEKPAVDPREAEQLRIAARRDALVSLGVCLAGFFALDVALRVATPSRRLAAESFYMAKPPRFEDDPIGFDVLVTGDSRVLHGIDPDAIERVARAERGEDLRVFNGGMPGAPPMAQLAWIRRALTRRPRRPRVVVMSISPYMFSSRIARTLSRESLGTMYRPRDVVALVRAGAPLDDVATALNGGLWAAARLRPRLLEVLTQFNGLRDAAGFDPRGFTRNGEVDPVLQSEHARGRALGYRTEMWRPATFGNEQQGYFVEALHELRDAGVTAIVVNAPAASQMQLAYGPNSIYAEHIAWLERTARANGARYFDAEHTPAIADEDFNDGDHLGGSGASRYSAWLAHHALIPALGGPRATSPQGARPSGCRVLFDFEAPGLDGWQLTGDAFRGPPAVQGRRFQQGIGGYVGAQFVDSFTRIAGDSATGTAVSPEFTVDGATLWLRVGGGSGNEVRALLRVDGRVVREARGLDDESLRDVSWDVRAWRGQRATLELVDQSSNAWGHLLVDDVALCP